MTFGRRNKKEIPKETNKEMEKSKTVIKGFVEKNDLEKPTFTGNAQVAQRSRPDDVGIGIVSAQKNPMLSPSRQTPASASVPTQLRKGNRRGKNTTVVSLQMPVELVKVLDDIADAGAFRNRSDVILQAVRAFPEVSRRIFEARIKGASQDHVKKSFLEETSVCL